MVWQDETRCRKIWGCHRPRDLSWSSGDRVGVQKQDAGGFGGSCGLDGVKGREMVSTVCRGGGEQCRLQGEEEFISFID